MAHLKVIHDGLAYLFAHSLQLDWEKSGNTVPDGMFETWEDEWKGDTAELILGLVGGDIE